METEVIVAIISAIAAMYSATIAYAIHLFRKQEEKHSERLLAETKQSAARERQMFHDSVMSPLYPIREWTRFVAKVRELHANTQVDRLLLLVAVNGEDTPTHASVIWEYRTEGETYSYVDVPLDDDYVYRLRKAKEHLHRFRTQDVQGTRIGRFYSDEGVTESIWAMVGKKTSLNTNQIAYKYISVATHDPEGFTDPKEVERIVENLVSEFRVMLSVSGFGPL